MEPARVSRRDVIVDFAARRSLDVVADALFGLKKGIDQHSRRFRLRNDAEFIRVFAGRDFVPARRYPQYFWPMALYQGSSKPALSRLLEGAARTLGLFALFGSPVLAAFVRASSPGRSTA